MKKLVFSFLALLFISFTAINAQEVSSAEKATSFLQQEDKVKIKVENLPEAVKTTLQADEYKGWTIATAYHYKSKEQYEVELRNAADTKVLFLDKDGKVVG